MTSSNVEKLFEGDPRAEVVLDALLELLYERADGMPIPQVLGVLELAKHTIIQQAIEDK